MAVTNPASTDKGYLRDFYREQRQKLCEDIERKSALDVEIQTRLLISHEYRAAATVLLYMARPYEIATSLILHAALSNHKTVGLPVCLEEGKMIFRRVEKVSELIPGKYGILEPPALSEAIIADEDTLCVCPALCCDMRGYRLGFGGGYYDRYLADFKGVKAALCYADSVIPTMQDDEFDVRMNVIHTDSFTRYMK